MNKQKLFNIFLSAILTTLFFVQCAQVAEASVKPTVSFSSIGNDSIQIKVNGDPNSSVQMYQYVPNTSSNAQLVGGPSLGTTNSDGYFLMTVSALTFGVQNNANIYVIVNGQQSDVVVWPYLLSTNSSTFNTAIMNNINSGVDFILGQNTLNLTPGRDYVVTVYNNIPSSTFFISNNTDSSIANPVLGEGQIDITAKAEGSTVITVCNSRLTYTCGSVKVNVSTSFPGNTSGDVNVSKQIVYLPMGQSTTVYLSNGTNYSIANNSSSTVASASLSGNSLLLTSKASIGFSVITVCSTGMQCANVYVMAKDTGSSMTSSSINNTSTVSAPLPVPLVSAPTVKNKEKELAKSSTKDKVFTRSLQVGSVGEDVKELQKMLIASNSGPMARKLAKNGLSKSFGAITKSALIEFQKAKGISPAVGVFGPKTRVFFDK